MAEIFNFYVQDNRTIQFPKNNLLEPIMQEDYKVATWRFRIPKVLNGIDMSGWAWWFVYTNAKNQQFSELLTLVDDIDEPGSFSTADYDIDYSISYNPGSFSFSLEAINAESGGAITGEWHTKTYSHKVDKTLQGNQAQWAETESDIISALIVEVQNKVAQLVGGATPEPKNLIADMTDTKKVYLYVGEETGESTNYWYYYNGSAWVAGGLYASGVTVDSTPTQGSNNAVSSGGVYEQLAKKLSISASLAVAVPDNTDFDTLKTAGTYKITSNAHMATMINAPGTAAGSIIVIETSSSTRLYQIYFPNDASVNRYSLRYFNGTTWSPWKIVAYKDDIPQDSIKYTSQTLTDEQQAQARANISAISAEMTFALNSSDATRFVEETDLNDVKTVGNYYANTQALMASLLNKPPLANGGRMLVFYAIASTRIYQIWFESGADMHIFIRFYNGSAWSDWTALNGTNIVNNNTVYENTYNITSSPTITTDTNRWLASTGDTTDRTSDIMTMLTSTGYCKFGEGVFYVSGNIDLPEGACIEGCGNKTVVRLLDSVTSGYVFKVQRHNTIKNLCIKGADSTITSWTATVGTRHGIYYTANYDGTDGETTSTGVGCRIDNVSIQNLTGYGIYTRNTGLSPYMGIYISQVWIYACHTGLCFDYRSEFNKIVNGSITRCYIACRNDSGNNGFENCTFHATYAGFVMDNSNNDKPNNAHGYAVSCTFCHIGDNAGIAILSKNITAGFIFSDLQVHYNSIELYDSEGIQFNNVQFGRGVPASGGGTIKVDGGALIVFNGCIFMHDDERTPNISIINNTKVKFVNCFGSATGNAISA